jgi:hypothetical protein
MRRLLIAAIAIALAATGLGAGTSPAPRVARIAIASAATSTAATAKCNQNWPLHPGTRTVRGSCGKRVKDLQWELGGHKPYAMHQAKPTFKAKPNGLYGARTKAAVLAMKFRLGYPKAGQCGFKRTLLVPTVTPWFLKLLRNEVKRSTCWIGLAAARVERAIRTGVTVNARFVQTLELSQLGTEEDPPRSNRGYRISYGGFGGPYQGSTGAFGQAWCASFQTWALKLLLHHGFGSANDAYVPTIAEYARARGWLSAKPKFGSFVVFLSANYSLVNAFHIGFVVRVTASGIQTIEGNATDAYGGGVHEIWRPFASNRMVYVNVPGLA